MSIELETTESIILGDKANNKLKDSETNLTNSTDEYNNKNKIVIMSFAAESDYYTARSEQGMTLKEAKGVFEIIKEAEQAK